MNTSGISEIPTASLPTPVTATSAAVGILNEFLLRDPEGCQKFLEARVHVNSDMAKRGLVTINGTEEKPKVGFLSVLNGALAKAGLEKVVTIRDDADVVQGFCAGKQLR
jgi:hypothetical protein